MRGAAVAASVAIAAAALPAVARAGDDDDAIASHEVIFARDTSLWRTDAKGKGPPVEIATLSAPASDVRALATDAAGKVLLADVGGTWQWMPLDGKATALTALACSGPATLAPDGSCVVCPNAKGKASIVNLASGKVFDLSVPGAGAVITGAGDERRLVWSDGGLWSAPPGKLKEKTQVAPESPLRSLSIAPDGSRALGVYAGEIHDGKKSTKPGELLFQFALDGTAARRKSIRDGAPVMWSHDSQWVLVQDGAQACLARAVGGEYKCWKGYTGVGIAPDGSWALLMGTRKDAARKPDEKKPAKVKEKKKGASAEGEDGTGDEDADGDAAEALTTTGPMSLYRAPLTGAFADPPSLIERVVDGTAAVWLP
jgi:hypothetical protein